jgi:hypothetical protein
MTIQAFVNNPLSGTSRRQSHPNFTLLCDPNASPSGGSNLYRFCGLDDDDDAAVQFSLAVTCKQNPTTGALTVTNDARLEDGCGTDSEDRKNSIQWTVILPPFSPSNPTPGADQIGLESCYSDDVFPPSNPCTENAALLDLRYTSKPAP